MNKNNKQSNSFTLSNDKISVSDYVLRDFDEEEKQLLENLKDNITKNLAILIDKKLDLFSSTVNNK